MRKWIIFISFHSFCFLLSLSKEFSSDLSLCLETPRTKVIYTRSEDTPQKHFGIPEFRSQLLFSALVKQKSEQTMQR
jgi:hypothetical protein